MENQTKYDIDSIKTLKYPDNVRKRPEMYIGPTNENGILTCFREILNNSVDEHLAGFCNTIDITVENGVYIIKDNGRGVPFELDGKFKGKPILETIFGELHAGRNFVKKEVYSTGINGVGSSCVNALSTRFEVISCREGKEAHITFEKGIKTSYQLKSSTKSSGTTVQFVLDSEIFTIQNDTIVEGIVMMISGLKYACPNLTINLTIDKMVLDVPSIDNITFDDKDNWVGDAVYLPSTRINDTEVKIAFRFDDTLNGGNIKSYCNTIETSEGGTHVTGFKRALSAVLSTYINDNKLIKEKFTPDDIYQGLNALVSVFVLEPKYSSQTKQKLTNPNVMGDVVSYLNHQLKIWLDSNPKDIKLIANRIALSAKARIAQKRALENVKKDSTTSLLNSGAITKFSDCLSNDPEITELFIVEGDSANGTVGVARNKFYQAVYRLKGKPLNVYGNDVTKSRSNKEIDDLFQILKCGTGRNFDIEKLKFGKIIILSDKDVDGCLSGDTYVQTVEDGLIRIDDLYNTYANKPFKVYAWDIENDQKVEAWAHSPSIKTTVKRYLKITCDDGTTVSSTKKHLFLMNDLKYKRAHELIIDDVFSNGKSIIGLEWIYTDRPKNMWDITVEEYHNFLLEGDIVSHNSHIQMLLMTLFGEYFKPLIEAGRIYVGKPPLYRVTRKGKDPIFIATDDDLVEFVRKERSKFIQIDNMKNTEYAIALLDNVVSKINTLADKYDIDPKIIEYLLPQIKKEDEAEDTDELDVEFDFDNNTFSINKFVIMGNKEEFLFCNDISVTLLEDLLEDDLLDEYRLLMTEYRIRNTNGKDLLNDLGTVVSVGEHIQNTLNKTFTILRMKGLGESDADDLEVTTINPKTRSITKIYMSDDNIDDVMNAFMGKGVDFRKQFLEENIQYADTDDLG